MAIAFDTATIQVLTAGTSPKTWSHTCTGSNQVLLVFTLDTDVVPTGITYAGVSMTSLKSGTTSAGSPYSCWGLLNPATGANTVSIAFTGSATVRGGSASYTGVKQSGLPDATAAGGLAATGASSFSNSITTVADNAWIFAACEEQNGTATSLTAGTNMTSRQTNVSAGNYALMIGDTNAAITPAGATSQSFSWAGTGSAYPNIIQVSLAPVVAATANGNFLAFM